MKAWSKYIILIIIVFAIFLCKGETVSSKNNQFDLIEQLASETESLTTDFSYSDYHQHISFVNTKRVQKNSFRRENVQRYYSCAIKTNKVTNLYLIEYTLNRISHKNSVLSEPSYRLIRLGKLII